MIAFDRYSDFRNKLKHNKGIIFPLLKQDNRNLYLTPLSFFTNQKSTQILVNLEAKGSYAQAGSFIFDYNNPPRNALKLVIQGFPMREAGIVYAFLCAIFFPVKAPKNPLNYDRMLDWPGRKIGQLCKRLAKKVKTKKQKTTKSNAIKTTPKNNRSDSPTAARTTTRRKTSPVVEAEYC